MARTASSRQRSTMPVMAGEADYRRTWPAQPFLTQSSPSAAISGVILYAHNSGAIRYPETHEQPGGCRYGHIGGGAAKLLRWADPNGLS